MECPNCGIEMQREEVLVSKTTSPDQDDIFELMWWCEHCEIAEPLERTEYESEE